MYPIMSKPYMCPICLGKGIVCGGFYVTLPGCDGISSSTSEQCKSCNGQGIIYVDDTEDIKCK